MAIRVLCCSGSLEGGGSERQLWQLATGLDAERFEAELYLLYRQGLYLSQIPPRIPVHDFWSSHSPHRFGWPGQIRRQQIQQLRQIIRQQKIDVVYDRTFHMSLLTAAACRATSTPRVSVIVSPPSLDFTRSRERFRWLKKRLLSAAYRDLLCRPVAVSDAVADDAASFYSVPRARFETIASPIDVAAVERAAKEIDADCTRVTATEGLFKIAVVGRLSSEKGQALAIAAVNELKATRPQQAVRLTIIGDGPDRQALEQAVIAAGLESCVQFTGRLANPYPWIEAADLLCIPSRYEGLPNVALEGMCLRSPIVATDCSGALRELLGKRERGVLVPADDVDALAAALRERLDAPEAWRERARQAAMWVREHHALQPWLDRMQQLFQQRIASRKQT